MDLVLSINYLHSPTDDEIILQENGRLVIPTRPGLGVNVNMDALHEFENAAKMALERGAGHGKGQAALAVPVEYRIIDGFKITEMEFSDIVPVLIVGCGVIAHYHFKAMHASKKFYCIAVCDTENNAAETLAKEISKYIPSQLVKPVIFNNLEEALSANKTKKLFKAVWILTPNVGTLHLDLAKKVLEENYHVFLEKPISLNIEDGLYLCKMAKKIESHLAIGENAAYWKPVLAIQNALQKKLIGPVHGIRAKCWESAGGPWAECYKTNQWISTGEEGPLFDSATHWIRPLRMWFGEIISVIATASHPVNHIKGPSSIQGLLQFASGQVAVFESILAPLAISDQPFFVLQGTQGEIVLEGFNGEVNLYTGVPTKTKTYGERKLICKSHWDSSYEEEIIAFSQMLSSKSPGNGLSPEEAIIDLSVVIALFKSALHSKKEDGWTKVEKVNLH